MIGALASSGSYIVLYPGNSGKIIYLPPKVSSLGSASNFDEVYYTIYSGVGGATLSSSAKTQWVVWVPHLIARKAPVRGKDHNLRIQGV